MYWRHRFAAGQIHCTHIITLLDSDKKSHLLTFHSQSLNFAKIWKNGNKKIMISSSLDTASPKKNIVCFRPKLLKQKLFYRFQKKKKKKNSRKGKGWVTDCNGSNSKKRYEKERAVKKRPIFFFLNLTYRLVEVIKNKIKNKFPTYPLVKWQQIGNKHIFFLDLPSSIYLLFLKIGQIISNLALNNVCMILINLYIDWLKPLQMRKTHIHTYNSQ